MPHPFTLLSIALGALASWGLLALLRGLSHVAAARRKIASLVATHLETLARRRLTLVKTDHYGLIDEGAWRKEYRYFIEKLVMPQLDARERRGACLPTRGAARGVDRSAGRSARARARSLARHGQGHVASRIRALVLDGAARGRLEGARHRHLGRSGRRCGGREGGHHHRAAMQAPPQRDRQQGGAGGFTARKHYGATAAAVVSNAGFTRSAEALSRTTGVLLCHYSDLARLDDLLRPRGFGDRSLWLEFKLWNAAGLLECTSLQGGDHGSTCRLRR